MMMLSRYFSIFDPAGNYMFKVNNINTKGVKYV